MIEYIEEKAPLLALRLLHTKEKKPLCRAALPEKGADIYYLFGLVDKVKPWTAWLEENPRRQLVFLDTALGRWKLFLQQDIPRSPRLHFIDPQAEMPRLYALLWQFYFLSSRVLLLSEDLLEAKEQFLCSQKNVRLSASEYRDFGVRVLKNHYHHLTHTKEVIEGKTVFGRFCKVPAILCGSGPSLQQELKALHALKQHALIVAGGSSVSLLEKNSLVPHIIGGVDPKPDREAFLSSSAFAAPLFYSRRFDPHLAACHVGPLCLMPTSGTFALEKHLYEASGGDFFALDVGWNVSNFLLYIVYHLGCDPIIVVGMDHAYPWKGEGECYISKTGKKVGSRADLVMGAQYMADFVKTHRDRKWFDATASGLSLEGWQATCLDALSKKVLLSPIDIEGLLAANFVSTKPLAPVSLKTIQMMFTKGVAICKTAIEEGEGRWPLWEVELKEIGLWDFLLTPLWAVWRYPLLFDGSCPKSTQFCFFYKVLQRHLEAIRAYV